MTVNVGIVGIGVVGGGCVDIIKKHGEDFKRHFGVDINLARVCSIDMTQAKAHGVEDIFTTDYHDIINDPTIDIVVELIGGTGVAKSVVLEAFAAGKNVVTANKALMATYGRDVMHAAAAAHKEIAFEASVGGGIPIIQPLKRSLVANEISCVMGIVNGTTNYMLTSMAHGLSYADALKQAQMLGYAEANPSADVDGFDAAAKIAILASIAFNSRVTINDVYTEGISNLTVSDLNAARDMGYVVKLLAIGRKTPAGVEVRVHPAMVPASHPLATVNGVDNAIYVLGDFVGPVMFYGQGAGSGPAASAVMGDVLEVARCVEQGCAPLVGCTCTDNLPIVSMDTLKGQYYLRFTVADKPGVLAKVVNAFNKYEVSVSSIQQTRNCAEGQANLCFVTHESCEANVQAVREEVKQFEEVVADNQTLIRLVK